MGPAWGRRPQPPQRLSSLRELQTHPGLIRNHRCSAWWLWRRARNLPWARAAPLQEAHPAGWRGDAPPAAVAEGQGPAGLPRAMPRIRLTVTHSALRPRSRSQGGKCPLTVTAPDREGQGLGRPETWGPSSRGPGRRRGVLERTESARPRSPAAHTGREALRGLRLPGLPGHGWPWLVVGPVVHTHGHWLCVATSILEPQRQGPNPWHQKTLCFFFWLFHPFFL